MSRINDVRHHSETKTVPNEIANAGNRTRAVALDEVSPQDEVQSDLSALFLTRKWTLDCSRLIFTEDSPGVTGLEQFRSLRSRVYQLQAKRPMQSILVSSALGGEGKTFVAANFALALAKQEGRTVLLVDADLRKPNLHEWFGAPSQPGLSELLADTADLGDVVQSGPIPNLWLLPGGAPAENAAELLGNNRMAGVLARLSRMFDWIVLDSSPVLSFEDAATVSRACDAVLLVAKADFSPYDVVQKALQRFRDVWVLGMVLNGALDACHPAYQYAKQDQGRSALGPDISTVTEKQFSFDGALRSYCAANRGEGLTGRERRLYPRHPVAIPVRVKFGDSVEQQYVTVDLSEHGMALCTECQLELGTIVQVSFTVPGTNTLFEAKGEVVWSRQDGRCGIRTESPTLRIADTSNSTSLSGEKA